VSSQQRTMDGTGPKMNNPGGGPKGRPEGMKDGTVAESGRDSKPITLARAEWFDWPAELCLPSDLCDDERSVIGWLPKALPVLMGKNSVEDREP